jgi:ABC-type uncharacterized transport system YnjBCD ATPase subunit
MVWIDEHQAIITTEAADGRPMVEQLGRGTREAEAAFDARAVDAVLDRDPVSVAGPAFARVAFERAFVAVTHRPERLYDIEPEIDAHDAGEQHIRRS